MGRSSCFDAHRGCLVLSNLQGLTDVLFIGMKLCPVFAFCAADGGVVAYGLLGALRRAGGDAEVKGRPLPEILEEAYAGGASGNRNLDGILMGI